MLMNQWLNTVRTTTYVAEKYYLMTLTPIHVLPKLKDVCVVICVALPVFVVTVNIKNCLSK